MSRKDEARSTSPNERSRLLRTATANSARPPYLRQASNMSNRSAPVAQTSSPNSSNTNQREQSPLVQSPHSYADSVEIPEHGLARPPAKSYWAYYIPAMTWIPHYQWSYLLGDTVAGLTLASFQIPIMMSYANMAFVPTVSGLYGLVVPPLMYALLGSVPQMVVGPEAPISMVVSQAVSPYVHKSRSHHKDKFDYTLDSNQVAGIIAGTSGAILLLAGLFRFGFIDSVLSRALLRGFISAVGIVMIIDQLPSQLGIADLMHKVTGTHPSTAGKIKFLVQYAHRFDPLAAKVAFAALITILALRYGKRRLTSQYKGMQFLPEILLVVVCSALLSDYFDLDQEGLTVVGDVKPESLSIEFPFTAEKLPDVQHTFSSSFFAAVLGFFESIIAAKSLGSMYDVNVSTNRELVALGTLNLGASLFSALPSFGGYARSKVNASAGAKTQMSSVVLALTTIMCVMFAMHVFFYLPDCVLSSVITVVGISLLEEAPEDIRFYWKVRGYHDLLTLTLTLLTTIFYSVETGIAVGVLFSVVRVIHHATRPRIQILGRIPGTNAFRNADELPHNLEAISGCLIVKIPEPLTFANTGDLKNRLTRLEMYGSMKIHPAYPRLLNEEMSHHIILDLRGMTECDASAVQILHELVVNYIKRNIVVFFVRMPQDCLIRERFEKSGINHLLANQAANDYSQAYFESIHEALSFIDSDA